MARPGPNSRKTRDFWPAWRYSPNGEGQIFQCEADVPYGWTKKKGQLFEPKSDPVSLDRDTLIQLLNDKGITPAGWWSVRYMKEMLE